MKKANVNPVQHTTGRQTFYCINGPVPWKPSNGYVAKTIFSSRFPSMEAQGIHKTPWREISGMELPIHPEIIFTVHIHIFPDE